MTVSEYGWSERTVPTPRQSQACKCSAAPPIPLWGDPLSREIVVAANCQHSPLDCQVTCMNKPG